MLWNIGEGFPAEGREGTGACGVWDPDLGTGRCYPRLGYQPPREA